MGGLSPFFAFNRPQSFYCSLWGHREMRVIGTVVTSWSYLCTEQGLMQRRATHSVFIAGTSTPTTEISPFMEEI